MGLARIDEMLCHKPDMVIVCFGLNDSTKDIDGIKEYKDSLEKIFENALWDTNYIYDTQYD